MHWHLESHAQSKRRVKLAYLFTAPILAALFYWLHRQAIGLQAPSHGSTPTRPLAGATAHPDVILHLLLALVTILVVAQIFGALARLVGQPPVIGEVIAGIALGPSLLGRVSPAAAGYLFPDLVFPQLSAISQVGVILFMFLLGAELDTTLLRKHTHAALAISHASIVVPFALAGFFSLWLYPRYASPGVSFENFAAFMGVAMSITAFPVLARVLTDRALHKTPLGLLAISCAAIDDATAWCLLALLVGFYRANAASAFWTVALTPLYVAALAIFVRPYLTRITLRQDVRGTLPAHAVPATLAALLISALITESIGIHAIFGAFVFGALIPHQSLLARKLSEKLEDVVLLLLLPAFFACTGMRTELGLLGSAGEWLACLLALGVASAGKIGGSIVGARLSGLGWRDSASVGALMNARGLMELVVLNVGLELGVISRTVFAMMVLMAVGTTLATAPLLTWLQRRREQVVLAATAH